MSTITATFAPVQAGDKPGACPHCGSAYSHPSGRTLEDASKRIAELETQVYIMTSKATAAADKLADYEDELRRLKSHSPASPEITPTGTGPEPNPAPPSFSTDKPEADQQQQQACPSSSKGAGGQFQDRLTSFLGARKTNSPGQSTSPARTPRECDLEAALAREQALRRQAEGQLTDVNGELEDLSAQLFQQANEMVAAERKARAKLEERVEILEKRDVDKRKRLERLENAVKRIDRVKGLLSAG